MPAKFVQTSRLTRGISGTAEAKVDPCGARFKRSGRVVESRGADAEHPNPLSRKPAKVDIVGRMGITLRGKLATSS